LTAELVLPAFGVVVCPGVLETSLVDEVCRRRAEGALLAIGPRSPALDARLQESTFAASAAAAAALLPDVAAALGAALDALAGKAASRPSVAPAALSTTLFEDDTGRARVAFLINAASHTTQGRFGLAGLEGVVDALTGEVTRATGAEVSLVLEATSVRMLELDIET
jgi:hypothetical protein